MKLKLKDIAVLSVLSALMFMGDQLLEALPNIHLVGVLVVATTAVYKWYALLPIYVYVLSTGLIGGFSLWWIPYLYVWAVLWGFVMLMPKKLPEKAKYILYIILCTLHGFLFGTLYAPVQALLFGLDFKGMIIWIINGFPFDIIHGVGNLILSTVLLYPIIKVLKSTDKYAKRG